MMCLMATILRRRRHSAEATDEKNDSENHVQFHILISICPPPAFEQVAGHLAECVDSEYSL